MNSTVIALVVVPLAGGGLCLIEKGFPALPISRAVAILVPLAGIALTYALLNPVLLETTVEYRIGGFTAPIAIRLRVDGLAWLGVAACYFIALMAATFSIGRGIRDPYYYALFLIMVGAMTGTVIADDLFTMFVTFELVSIAAFVLIGYSRKPAALLASLKYLFVSSVAIVFYLLGLFVLYRHTGSLTISTLSGSLGALDGTTKRLVLGALIAGVATRGAIIPFHAWLPDAHAQAPDAVSAVLSGVMIKVGVIAMWRLLSLFGDEIYYDLLLWVGSLTAVGAALRALAQSDAKKLLAWSSISQIGYIVAAFGAATAVSRGAAAYYMLAHAQAKALLFLAVGITFARGGDRNLRRASGSLRTSPVAFALFAFGALSISGIPPFNGFVAKKLVLKALDAAGKDIPYWLLFVAAVGTTAALIKLSAIFWRKRPPGDAAVSVAREHGAPSSRRLDAFLHAAPVLLGASCIVTGILPSFWQAAIYRLLNGEEWRTVVSVSNVYGASGILEALLVGVLGSAAYFALRTSRGKSLLARIESIPSSIEGATALVVLGFICLGGMALL